MPCIGTFRQLRSSGTLLTSRTSPSNTDPFPVGLNRTSPGPGNEYMADEQDLTLRLQQIHRQYQRVVAQWAGDLLSLRRRAMHVPASATRGGGPLTYIGPRPERADRKRAA